MQTTKQPTRLRTAASDYQTLVQQAAVKVSGFEQLYKELEPAINISGKSKSILTNYAPHLAHLALHYHQREENKTGRHQPNNKGHTHLTSTNFMVTDRYQHASFCKRSSP